MKAAHLKKIIEAIHATPQMLVFDFAGAGAEALAWLHGVGGSSRTILEATDRYATRSLIDVIGLKPKHFTSPQVARTMATRAYVRAGELVETGTPVAGIGCTAAIATDRQKRGDHRGCVAVCDAQGVTIYDLTLTKGLRTRQQEEELVSLLILRAIAKACNLAELPELPVIGKERVQENAEKVGLLDRLIDGEIELVMLSSKGHLTPGRTLSNLALLSGAFNPLHEGHRRLARVAADILGQDVHFELPLVNANKAPIDPAEAQRRLAQFIDFAPLLLSTAPLFSQKARLFPHSMFILGVDTVKRLIEPRFYHNDLTNMLAALEGIRRAGCRFLVANRLQGNQLLTFSDLSLPVGYRELFEEIPITDFRMDISSTGLRNLQSE
jgi:nicotinic acid mononucleotide adenylyltransferase